MKRLFEEFKKYENLWEAVEEAPESKEDEIDREFELSASVEIALNNYPYNFELKYDGFRDDWEEDSWDPESLYGHTTISRTTLYDDYTYEVSPEDVLDSLLENILPKDKLTPAKIEKAINKLTRQYRFSSYKTQVVNKARKIIADYQKLEALCEQKEGLEEKLEIYVADQLEDFFLVFYNDLKELYADEARDSQFY